MSNLEILRNAIENRQPIRFRYVRPGKVPADRLGHPHAVFLLRTKSHPEGRFYLDLWQTGGHSESGCPPDWRMFCLEDVVGVESLPGRFSVAETYKPNSPRYEQIVARV